MNPNPLCDCGYEMVQRQAGEKAKPENRGRFFWCCPVKQSDGGCEKFVWEAQPAKHAAPAPRPAARKNPAPVRNVMASSHSPRPRAPAAAAAASSSSGSPIQQDIQAILREVRQTRKIVEELYALQQVAEGGGCTQVQDDFIEDEDEEQL